MIINLAKAEAKLYQAKVSYFLAGRMVRDLFCKVKNYTDWDESDRLMDECSKAECTLKVRYEALAELCDELLEEEYHYEFTLRPRMYDSLRKYRTLAAKLDAETKKRATA